MARVLILDDERSIRVTLGQFLQQDGHVVDTAEDADAAMSLCRSHAYDVVLTDIILPRVSGMEFLRWFREHAPDVPVIIMTGEPTVDTAVEAVRAGAYEYLCKPITKGMVLSAVTRAVRWKALSDEKKRLEAENQEYQRNLERLVAERTEALERSLKALADTNRRLEETLAELHRTQQQVVRQERLNALGELAGGIAHDFNNMLMPIITYSTMVCDSLPEDHPLRPRAEALVAAVERSAALPRQLLAFSRKQVQELEILDLNTILSEMRKMLERLIREDIEFVVHSSEAPALVLADAAQMEQVVMNLVLNARDAMPDGGRLVVRTEHVQLDSPLSSVGCEIPPGSYVRVSVEDTGCGMAPETMERIFEPFFTTKAPGKGTGLGLASVYGIVQQTRGYIRVESVCGKGSTFEVYLPPAEREPAARVSGAGQGGAEVAKRSATILLVEDDPAVRDAIAETLTVSGFKVVVARSGEEAVEEAQRRPDGFDLLVTDVVMPGMNGGETAERIRSISPGIRVLFISGHTEDEVVRRGVMEGSVKLLRKPFLPKTLREEVLALLAT
ncbi:MAG: response regulator [Armatimonadota bacterium]|nr:response regulator [Armatimonadota bacterium]